MTSWTVLKRLGATLALLTALLAHSVVTVESQSLTTNRESSLLDGNTNRRDDDDAPAPRPTLLDPFNHFTGSGGSDSDSAAAGTRSNSSAPELQGFLPLPPGYNKLAIPKVNGSSIFVVTYLSIRAITDLDEEKGLLELDTELGMTWLDWEIWRHFLTNAEAQERAAAGPDEIILDSQFLKSIWKPDVFIEELASVDTTYLLSKQITLAFLVRHTPIVGTIRASSRQTLKVRCDMDFSFYPADTQRCPLNLRSYTYAQNELFLLWAPNQSVYLDQTDDPNYDFQVSNVEPGNTLYDLFTTYQAPCCTAKNFSTLSFTIQIRRNLTYHMVQTFLPSVLLILITWLCFLLPQDMVEARIGISMTTLLTIIAMFAAVREQAPSVSYTMAIDVWMVFCIFLIFLALVLFTVMYWMRWKFVRKPEEADAAAAAAVAAKNKDPEGGGRANEGFEPTEGPKGGDSEEAPPPDPVKRDRYIKIVSRTKHYAFTFFAVVFATFLVVFGIGVLATSKYYEWDPSPKYNALEEVEGDGNRLFTKQEAPFWANATVKAVEAEFRYTDLQTDIICPYLKQLNPEDPCDAEEEEEDDDDEEGAGATAAADVME